MKSSKYWSDTYASSPKDANAIEAFVEVVQQDALSVPGVYICPKCGFHLTLSVLHTFSGTVGVDTTVADRACPNDGELMRSQTWEERCRDIAQGCERQVKRAVAAEDEIGRMKQAIEGLTANVFALSASCDQLRTVLRQHHEHASESVKVYFEQDGKPIDICTDLGESYQESTLCDSTVDVLNRHELHPQT